MKKILFKIKKFLNNPIYCLEYLVNIKINKIRLKEYVGLEENRSDSEDGLYIQAVESALLKYKSFCNFKRNPNYTAILEHVSYAEGQGYLDIIKKDYPSLLKKIVEYKKNDIIGNPIRFDYDGIGSISPSTLRYIKVCGDLDKYFGPHIGDKIIEIGGGYGGQALINDITFKIKSYEITDLPQVLRLISKYLESHILNGSYKALTLNQKVGDEKYDLVISNYAFSELPKVLQLKYVEKILKNASKGYLTMNSGRTNLTGRSSNKITIDELRASIPTLQVIEEVPITGPDNYIIIWGH